MSRKYKIQDQQRAYFVTFTVVHWIDVFIRDEYRTVFIDSVKYCQEHKKLEVYAWVIMPSHKHMILRTGGTQPLEGIIRDLKAFTSRSLRKILEDRHQVDESRRDWMLKIMYETGNGNGNNKDFQFWQQHSQPIELHSAQMMDRTLDYIHMNPVKAGFVDAPEAWTHSSARDYALNIPGPIPLHYF